MGIDYKHLGMYFSLALAAFGVSVQEIFNLKTTVRPPVNASRRIGEQKQFLFYFCDIQQSEPIYKPTFQSA